MLNNIIRELFNKGYTKEEIINMLDMSGNGREDAVYIMNDYLGVYKKVK